ncbi:uncharacterized protein B0H18DRAFT_424703 [Fomitopsis serialis]|uniref:uncharacterized protein n=1 Tax=Fomitopsis serialis TaxID=139415 RepID=UPI002008C8AE|nr:uncharacterized protein B0H18DRAFT_424703 [Neoantrodia serialis]KAH9924523.1 hypothetical protein B0H18DRAFT_424703 [Neoantrodia serialis]
MPMATESGISQRPRATINNLSQDVLLLILRDVFNGAQRQRAVGWDSVQIASGAPHDDRNPEHPSAEYLACVCPAWRQAMSCASVFWAQLVIWTGMDPTPLSRIRQYLCWSRNQPLEVYVMRRYDPSGSMEDQTERARVKAVVELLLPHVRRWRVLCMKLLHSRSLPLPRIDLVGHAEKLVRLRLDHTVDDAVAFSATDVPQPEVFDTPRVPLHVWHPLP